MIESNKRYFKRMYDDEYYIFDSQTISEKDFDEKVEYAGYEAFEDCMSGEDVINRLNELDSENKELKSDNDIKFWKLQFIRFYNSKGIIMHELGKAIEEGYEVSNEFKQYLHDLKVQNEKNVEKAKRLGI